MLDSIKKESKMRLLISLVFFPLFLYSQSVEKIRDIGFESFENKAIKRESEELKIVIPTHTKEDLTDPRYYVKIAAFDKYERTKLLEYGVDIFNISDNYVEGLIHKNLIETLSEKKFNIIEKKTLEEWLYINKDFPPQDADYHNYNETYEVLKSLSEKYPKISYLFSIGKSYEGREIWGIRINSTSKALEPTKKPGIVFIGNHHAREHLSNEIVLLLASYLLENSSLPEIKKYIDELDIYLIPMLNPDGVEYDIQTSKYRWWRKNTNKLATNSVIGVDLNRNYDFEWCKSGASTYQYSDTYCGKAPFSEPETKALKQFLENTRNIRIAVTYHSYGSLVLYPWGGKDEQVSDEKDRNAFIKHANQMAKIMGYKAKQSSDLYIASGDMADWAYDKLKILAFTVELEGGSFYPGTGIIKTSFEKNKNAALYLLSIAKNPYD